jgi:hypothetical protein
MDRNRIKDIKIASLIVSGLLFSLLFILTFYFYWLKTIVPLKNRQFHVGMLVILLTGYLFEVASQVVGLVAYAHLDKISDQS